MDNSKIKIAILGIGNCASSLVQGLEYYKINDTENGLISDVIGGYRVSDIEIVAAFDINKNKVGKDLSEAIFTEPNNTIKFSEVPNLNVQVNPGKTLDGIGKSDEAVKYYAECAIEAKVGFINCIPVFIARDKEWYQKFAENNIPLIGDDIKSQVGATIVHRALAQLFSDRGLNLPRSYQLNVGGNMDFLNMLEEDRLETKRTSKTTSVTSVANKGKGMEKGTVRIGPSDYVEWLEDRKKAFIRLEGEAFGGVPLNIELQLEVWDSPNSAGVVIDAIRYMKFFTMKEDLKSLDLVSAWLMKAPAEAAKDTETLKKLHELTHIDSK